MGIGGGKDANGGRDARTARGVISSRPLPRSIVRRVATVNRRLRVLCVASIAPGAPGGRAHREIVVHVLIQWNNSFFFLHASSHQPSCVPNHVAELISVDDDIERRGLRRQAVQTPAPRGLPPQLQSAMASPPRRPSSIGDGCVYVRLTVLVVLGRVVLLVV